MAYAIFTYEVSNNTTGKSKQTPLRIQFGEGVEQVAADGLNAPARTVNIDIGPIDETTAIAIHAFLDAQQGLPFQWTPIKPLPQVAALWRCEDYGFRRSDGGTIHGITATFLQFNSPLV